MKYPSANNDVLKELYRKSLSKWEKVLHHYDKALQIHNEIYSPYSFCFHFGVRNNNGELCVMCKNCLIDHSICDQNGRNGLISKFKLIFKEMLEYRNNVINIIKIINRHLAK